MKIKFMCKLVITEEINDITMEDVYSVDDIAKNIIDDLKKGLSPRGNATIDEPYLAIER